MSREQFQKVLECTEIVVDGLALLTLFAVAAYVGAKLAQAFLGGAS